MGDIQWKHEGGLVDYIEFFKNPSFGYIKDFCLNIKKVIFNDPATIIIWTDGTKTVVKVQNGEEYDPEKGMALCCAKKLLGNKSNFNNEFKKWLPKEAQVVNAPTVELDESIIQEVLNKRCMTAVANEYLVALHGKRPQGKWIVFDDGSVSCPICKTGTSIKSIPSVIFFRYCPYCGAKLRGEKEEEE